MEKIISRLPDRLHHLLRGSFLVAILLIVITQLPTTARAAPNDSPAECAAAGGNWIPGGSNELGAVTDPVCHITGNSISDSYKVPPTACDFSGYWGWTNVFINPVCTSRVLVAALVWPFVALANGILTIAGAIFNASVDIGIIKFGAWYQIIKTGVETGWMLVRDFANIAIIGIFTYIAISKIIGNERFGTNRMVARVLIVAVLINFSLLFTKIILDISHFVAREVYQVVETRFAPTTSSLSELASSATGGTLGSTVGIANAFMKFAHMTSAYDTWAAIRAQQERAGDTGFLFGVLSTAFFLAAAAVLLYGSVVIITRTVTLIFLILTSALAFASWLWPGFSDSEYGWKGWWQKLLNNALFAPLFMIFIFITLNVAQAMDAGWAALGQRGTLGALSTSPVANIGALMQLVLIFALFYGTIRIANALSAQWASNAARLVTGGVFLGGAGRLLGTATDWRQRRNYNAAQQSDGKLKQARAQHMELADKYGKNSPLAKAKMKEIDALTKRREAQMKRAGQDLNLFNAKPIKDLLKTQAGVTGTAAGQTSTKTFEEKEKEKAKVLEERFASAVATQNEKQEARDKAQGAAIATTKESQNFKAIAEERARSQERLDTATREHAEQIDTLNTRATQAKNAFDAQKARIDQAREQVAEASRALAASPDNPALRTQLDAHKENERIQTDMLARTKYEVEEAEKAKTKLEKKVAEARRELARVEKEVPRKERELLSKAKVEAVRSVDQQFDSFAKALKEHVESIEEGVGARAWKSIAGREKKKQKAEQFEAIWGDEAKEAKQKALEGGTK